MKKNYRGLSAAKTFLMLVYFAIVIHSAQAQELTARPDRGMSSRGSYQTTEIDSINLQNGSVNLQIPLASLPPVAGGKLSYTVSASYNSKLWDSHRGEVAVQPNTPGCDIIYPVETIQLADSGAGWRVGDGYYRIFFRDAREDYDYVIPITQTCGDFEYHHLLSKYFKPMLRMPDGSEHELKISSGYPFGSNYSDYQGTTRDHLRQYLRYTGSGPISSNNSFRLHTIDGTYISILVQPFTYDYPSNWTIYLKDGTEIQPVTGGQRTKDTNGNSILRGNRTVNNINEEFVRDEQTGREIKWSPTTHNGQNATKVEYQTVGGVWQNTMVVWGGTTVKGKLYNKQDWNPQGGENGSGSTCYRQQEIYAEIGVIREIIFPATEQGVSPQKFTFGYNSDVSSQVTTQDVRFTCYYSDPPAPYTRPASHGLGELSDVTTPTGAHIKYEYVRDGEHYLAAILEDAARYVLTDVITKKTVTHDGMTDIWTYDIPTSSGSFVTTGSVTNPDGSVNSELYNPVDITRSGSPGDGLGGLSVRSNQSGKIVTERSWTLLGGVTTATGTISQSFGINPVVDTEYTTLMDDNGNRAKMSAKKFQYDYNGELLQTIEYDWFDPNTVTYNTSNQTGFPLAVPSGATILRTVNNSYFNYAADYYSPNAYHNRSVGTSTTILGALYETTTGNSQTQTRFSYDGQAYGVAPTKGNVTQISSYNDTNNSWINVNSTYDTYGNVITKTDPKGYTTQIFYEDATHAMPTKTVVDPQNGTGQQIATTVYDFSTGLPVSSTDINGNVSSVSYINHLLGAVDPFGRPGTVFSPYVNIDGANKRQTAKTYYEDAARRTRAESDLYNENDQIIKSRESRDQLGRPVLSERNENGANSYTISSETIYGLPIDHTVMTSNPHRAAAASTDGWTRVKSDILGRAIEAATFSGAAQPPTNGTNVNWTGSVTTAYAANQTTVTDQAGKKRRSVSNAFGQLVRVDEPNDAGQLDVNNAPAQATNYVYDVLGNLTQVQQGVQTRTFQYDSLSRLKSATNPELGKTVSGNYVPGTINYSYDNNGNLTQKTDARGVQTTYVYDALNRVTQRSYANEPGGQAATPTVNYFYDDLTNAKGRLTKVASSVSTTEYVAFDVLGRVVQSRQTTDGVVYGDNTNPMTYKYNLSGALVEQKYPSGRIVRNVLDADGELSMVQSKKNTNSGFFTYADNFAYTVAGAVSAMQLGNGKWESMQFNSRLQPIQIALGTVQNGTDKLKLDFSYGTTQNNGNVLSQTITVPTETRNSTTYNGFTATQNYVYDSLNRLFQASETIAPNISNWTQTFSYDRYGNRTFNEQYTTTLPKNCLDGSIPVVCTAERPKVNPSASAMNNRLVGYTFDDAGNTTVDAEGRTFTYDAENKQTKVVNAQSQTIGEYAYDGDGKRVKKYVPSTGETTIFVYDASGKLVAEYANQITATPQVSYLTSDHLGSPRINTDADGRVTARHDYQPFGEEIQRASYGADDVKQKFTSYERDDETGLDFAQARMYANKLGRFTSVDAGPFTPVDPQNFNRYIYSQNNPIKFIDPTGKEIELSGDKAQEFLEYLEKNSGLKFKTKVKNGVTIITGASKNKDFKGEVNKDFAKIVSNVANASGTAKFNVSENQTVKDQNGNDRYDVFVDDNGNTFSDSTSDSSGNRNIGASNVDMADINSIASQDSTFAQALVGHFLIEGLEMRQRGANYDLGTEGAHQTGLDTERKILGQKDKRYQGAPDVNKQTGDQTYQFVYTNIQYDVIIKNNGSINVNKVSPPTLQRPKK